VATYNTGGLRLERESRFEFLARLVVRALPDVLCLQEVGDGLERFSQDYLGGRYPHLAVAAGNDARGLTLAILSRLPLVDVRTYADWDFPRADGSGTSRFSRDLLRVEVPPGWLILNAHFKSRRGGPAADRQRLSEAAAVRQRLGELTGPFLLCGDLNDDPESAALVPLLGATSGLVNALEKLPPRQRRTFPCRKGRHQLDYILFPEPLRERLQQSRVWPESRASDHAMVSAQFAL